MTVEELIEELKRFHPKDRVRVSVKDRRGDSMGGESARVIRNTLWAQVEIISEQ